MTASPIVLPACPAACWSSWESLCWQPIAETSTHWCARACACRLQRPGCALRWPRSQARPCSPVALLPSRGSLHLTGGSSVKVFSLLRLQVFGGGPVLTANPEPYADFFDVVLLGEQRLYSDAPAVPARLRAQRSSVVPASLLTTCSGGC